MWRDVRDGDGGQRFAAVCGAPRTCCGYSLRPYYSRICFAIFFYIPAIYYSCLCPSTEVTSPSHRATFYRPLVLKPHPTPLHPGTNRPIHPPICPRPLL